MAAKARFRDGAWYVVIDHKGKRQAKKIGADKQATKRIADEINVRLARGEFRLAERGLLFEDLAQEWIEKYPATRAIAPNTLDNYVWFVRKHLIPYFGTTPVADIGYEMVEAFIGEKRSAKGSVKYPGQPISDQSLRIGLVALRLILDRAIRVHKVLTANPALGVGRFARPAEDDSVDPFTGEELRAILAAAQHDDPEFTTFIRFWMQMGGRLGEVSAVQWQDLDMTTGKVIIRRTYSPGRADRVNYRPGPTKTRQNRVVSFLHPITEDTFEWRPGITDESRRVLADIESLPTRRLGPEAFLFGGDKPQPGWRINEKWRAVLEAAKIRYRSPEMLRHTWASTLLSRNAPLLYVQKGGGWKSAAVLLRVYSRWIEQALPAPPEPPAFPTQVQPVAGTAATRTRVDASWAQVRFETVSVSPR